MMDLLLDSSMVGHTQLEPLVDFIFEKSKARRDLRLDGELKVSELFDGLRFQERAVQ